MRVLRGLAVCAVFAGAVVIARAEDEPEPPTMPYKVFEKVKEGEWVALTCRLKKGGQRDEVVLVWRIEKVDGDKVTVRGWERGDDSEESAVKTATYARTEQPTIDAVIFGGGLPPGSKAAVVTDEDKVVEGKTFKCKKVAWSAEIPEMKMTAVAWFSSEVKSLGVVAIELTGEAKDDKMSFKAAVAGFGSTEGKADWGKALADIKAKEEPGGPRSKAREAAAVGALKTIAVSQTIFREGDKDENGVLDYGTLAALGKAKLVEEKLGSGNKQGYVFDARPSTKTPEFLWYATATPKHDGDRHFFINQAGVVYQSTKAIRVDPKKCELPLEGMTPVGR